MLVTFPTLIDFSRASKIFFGQSATDHCGAAVYPYRKLPQISSLSGSYPALFTHEGDREASPPDEAALLDLKWQISNGKFEICDL